MWRVGACEDCASGVTSNDKGEPYQISSPRVHRAELVLLAVKVVVFMERSTKVLWES